MHLLLLLHLALTLLLFCSDASVAWAEVAGMPWLAALGSPMTIGAEAAAMAASSISRLDLGVNVLRRALEKNESRPGFVRSCLSDGTKMTQRLTVPSPFAAPKVQHMPPGPHWHQGLPLSEREDCGWIRFGFHFSRSTGTQAEVQAAVLGSVGFASAFLGAV